MMPVPVERVSRRASARDRHFCAARTYAEPMSPLGDVDLEDSWVLDLHQEGDAVCLVVEAALGRDHPRFYWPPHPGEQHAYARARVRLSGAVTWIAGPFPPTAIDASDEIDNGDASGWEVAGTEHRLDGDWRSVFVTNAVIEVSWDSVE